MTLKVYQEPRRRRTDGEGELRALRMLGWGIVALAALQLAVGGGL